MCLHKASGKAAKKAGNGPEGHAKGDKEEESAGGRRATRSTIYKVLKQVHPDTAVIFQGHWSHHELFRQRHLERIAPRLLAWIITTRDPYHQPGIQMPSDSYCPVIESTL
ncbi:hypothetical protein GWK47_044507 [Chionoecetes opilio]|uniref:Uncharacterized protein n=1 Tax=Chionoecetes opilio TaxID=41210 RepID=A0A8J4Y839_CHIOP|nr:hypothetical protein GWK47_044507 [Chionoecetes opilio]